MLAQDNREGAAERAVLGKDAANPPRGPHPPAFTIIPPRA